MEAVKPAKTWKTIMLLTGQTTRDDYGKFIDMKNPADWENIMWTSFGFLLEQGLLVLDLQKQLYSFLVRCTELLLHDLDLSGLATVQIPMASYQHELLRESKFQLKTQSGNLYRRRTQSCPMIYPSPFLWRLCESWRERNAISTYS